MVEACLGGIGKSEHRSDENNFVDVASSGFRA